MNPLIKRQLDDAIGEFRNAQFWLDNLKMNPEEYAYLYEFAEDLARRARDFNDTTRATARSKGEIK